MAKSQEEQAVDRLRAISKTDKVAFVLVPVVDLKMVLKMFEKQQ